MIDQKKRGFVVRFLRFVRSGFKPYRTALPIGFAKEILPRFKFWFVGALYFVWRLLFRQAAPVPPSLAREGP